MKTIKIPPTELWPVGKDGRPEPGAEAVCPYKCPFRYSDDIAAFCTMKWCLDGGERFHIHPGPECPGPGEYALERVVRCREDEHVFRKQEE